MAKKTTKVSTEATADVTDVEAAAKFTPCRQCGNPGSCARAAKCSKGFK
jgi:hypothetical protein